MTDAEQHSQPWFRTWYERSHRVPLRVDDSKYDATIRVRYLEQPAPIDVRNHQHILDIRKDSFQAGLAQALAQVARVSTHLQGRHSASLNMIITNGKDVRESRPDHYCLWLREEYR